MNNDSLSDPATQHAPNAGDTASTNVLLEMLRELRGQREAFGEAQRLAASERRAERRWKIAFQIMVFGVPVIFGVFYLLFFLSTTGFKLGPFGNVVGVVRIEGAIGANERASAEAIVPLLEKAFTNDNVKAVVLSIDSPGGAPLESERIYTAMRTLKQKHPKPVVAVINNIGASAAYMVALHADKIIVGKYSLVGSIGAIMAPWQFDRAIAKVDVSQKVYASGKLKAFLNPFTPLTPEVDAKAQQLVDQLGGAFLQEVREQRGARLKQEVNVATGEVWPGPEAKVLGLADEVGTIDEYITTAWSGLKPYDFGPTPQSLQLFGRTIQDVLVGAVQRLAVQAPAVR